MAPIGMAHQCTCDDHGNCTDKWCLTHDQSFLPPLGQSSNSRAVKDLLIEMICNCCLPRVISHIVSVREECPDVKMFIAKTDVTKACQRETQEANSAAACVAQFQDLAFLALRLTFGGSFCPPAWTAISEMMTDLANDILHCPDWDPNESHSPMQDDLPTPRPLPDDIPFAKALPTAIRSHPATWGTVDSFIDDFIAVVPDIGDNLHRGSAVVPLVLHLFGRPVHPDEPVPRPNLMSLNKMEAEGAMEEMKIVLGWLLDTRRLMTSLPEEKHTTWVRDIEEAIEKKGLRMDSLVSIAGRLNHSACIVPTLRHFLHRLRAIECSKRPPRSWMPLNDPLLHDFKLFTTFLDRAKAGVSFNNITF